MKRNLMSIILAVIYVMLPLIAAFYKVLSLEVFIVFVAALLMMITQKPFNAREAKERKDTDRNSFWIIYGCSTVSLWVTLVDWAYLSQPSRNLYLVVLGFLTIVLGLAFRIYAIRTLGRHFTNTVQVVTDHKLITSGPYRYFRHPSYTGSLIAYLGVGVLLQSVIGIIASLALMGLAYSMRISAEEDLLQKKLDGYREYMKNTWALLPFF